MPVSFQILPQRQLIVFRYWGMVGLQEAMDSVEACGTHADYRPWMRQLCDLTGVTGIERDFPKLLKMQAKILDDLAPGVDDLVVLFYAPTAAGQEMAHMAQKSWEGLNSVIVQIQDNEAAVLDVLGLRETCLDDVLDLVRQTG